MLSRIVAFIHSQGAHAGIQLAHAGRKANRTAPFHGERALTPEEGAWTPVAPSAIAFAPDYSLPQALDQRGIENVIEAFRAATKRALAAGI